LPPFMSGVCSSTFQSTLPNLRVRDGPAYGVGLPYVIIAFVSYNIYIIRANVQYTSFTSMPFTSLCLYAVIRINTYCACRAGFAGGDIGARRNGKKGNGLCLFPFLSHRESGLTAFPMTPTRIGSVALPFG
jgi:hypothetical protein